MIITCENCKKSYKVPDGTERLRCSCRHRTESPAELTPRRSKCQHRGQVLRDVPCGCAGKPKIFACAVFGECIVKKIAHDAAKPYQCCQECAEWAEIG